MQFLITIFLSVLSCSYILAQSFDESTKMSDKMVVARTAGFETYDTRLKGIDGSPYLKDNWSEGYIVLLNGDTIQDLVLKIDVHNQEFVHKTESKMMSIPKAFVERIVFTGIDVFTGSRVDDNFVLKTHENERKIFKELVVGDYSVYRHDYCVLLKPSYNPAIDAGNINYQLNKKIKYYYEIDGLVKIVPSSRKKFMKEVAEHPVLQEAIKMNRFDSKDERDLINFFKTINK